MMEVRRQRIPESRSRHREAAACTSQTGARYSQEHSGTGRAQCPAWRILADHGAHVDWCVIGVQGLVKEAHQFESESDQERADDSDSDPDPEHRLGSSHRCTCQNCVLMPTVKECVCQLPGT